MLSDSQLKFIADVLVSLSQIFFASLVIPYIISGTVINFLVPGLLLTAGSWIMGLFILKDVN